MIVEEALKEAKEMYAKIIEYPMDGQAVVALARLILDHQK